MLRLMLLVMALDTFLDHPVDYHIDEDGVWTPIHPKSMRKNWFERLLDRLLSFIWG